MSRFLISYPVFEISNSFYFLSAGQSKRNHTDGRHEYQPDDDVFDKLFNEAPEKVYQNPSFVTTIV